jgi:hypothetical protein
MRPRLTHISERRARRRSEPRRIATPERPAPRRAPSTLRVDPDPDPETERAREAGGPLDAARYSCQCGYVFDASVSASVVCPHCGRQQAW